MNSQVSETTRGAPQNRALPSFSRAPCRCRFFLPRARSLTPINPPPLPPKQKTTTKKRHGEIGAIRDAAKTLGTAHLRGCVLYTSSEPCPMCMGACYWCVSCFFIVCRFLSFLVFFFSTQPCGACATLSHRRRSTPTNIKTPPLQKNKRARIDRVFYATTARDVKDLGRFEDEDFYLEFAKLPAERTIPSLEFMRAEAVKVWEEFSELPDRCHY